MRNLSGGNQQKVALGKWLPIEPRLLLLDEPTRGVDVGAKREIYQQLDRFTARGIAILLASSDLPELLALSDRDRGAPSRPRHRAPRARRGDAGHGAAGGDGRGVAAARSERRRSANRPRASGPLAFSSRACSPHPPAARCSRCVLVLLIGAVFDADGAFWKASMHRDALRQASVYGILACGMTLVIVTGGIDLAVGSILALARRVLLAGDAPLVVAGVVVGAGDAAGRRQRRRGLGRSGVAVPDPALHRHAGDDGVRARAGEDGLGRHEDLDRGARRRRRLPLHRRAGGVPRHRLARPRRQPVDRDRDLRGVRRGLRGSLLARHRWGRQLYAIGGNEEAARLSGVPVRAAKLGAYVASGALAAVAGICQAAQEQQGDPEAGAGYELSAIAIVVIGGTHLAGGRGGIGLTLVGTLTIGYLEKILSINAVPEATRLMLTGAIVIAAVLTQRRGDTR